MDLQDGFNPREYWEKRLSPGLGLHRVGHLAYGKAFNRALYAIRRMIFQKIMRSFCFEGIHEKTILDIGSGTGFYLNLWKKLGPKNIYGLDFTDASVEFCARRFPDVTMIHADISNADHLASIPDESIDCISVFDVLFHIVDDTHYEKAIHNISRKLKPEGYLFYSDNFIHHGTIREKHIVHRSLHEISAILENNDFMIIGRVPMFWLMGYPIDTKSPLIGKLWNLLMYPVRKSEIVGSIYAAILFFPERLLVSLCRESPTTEMMICKKKAR